MIWSLEKIIFESLIIIGLNLRSKKKLNCGLNLGGDYLIMTKEKK